MIFYTTHIFVLCTTYQKTCTSLSLKKLQDGDDGLQRQLLDPGFPLGLFGGLLRVWIPGDLAEDVVQRLRESKGSVFSFFYKAIFEDVFRNTWRCIMKKPFIYVEV